MSAADCTRCVELEQQVARLQGDIETMTHELGVKALRIGRLEKQEAEHRETDPLARDVREVLERWQQETGHDKCAIDPSSDRWERTRAMLRKPSVSKQLLIKAVRAAATDDWYQGRQPRNKKRCDDISTIFKSVSTIERLAGVFDSRPRDRMDDSAVLENGAVISREVAERLRKIPPHQLDALDVCDCGGLRFEHPTGECREFDTIARRVAEWHATHPEWPNLLNRDAA